jgi:hypothetical protein
MKKMRMIMMNKSKHIYQQKVFKQLQGGAVLMHPGLKAVLGHINSAIWLSQILYWYDKGESLDYIRKSRSQLENETGLTRDQQIRVEQRIKKLGVVSIEVRPGRPSPINHITINFDILDELLRNLRGIRTLDESTIELLDNKKPKLSDVSTDNQRTQNADNISKSTQKNTQRRHDYNPEGEGYRKFLEAKKKLIDKASGR